MLIALDYDGTYTADPELWESFITLCQQRGHEIVCVTMRYEYEAAMCSCKTYYTGRKAKKPWCENQGLNIDIWIDDNPNWIFEDAF